MHGDGFSVHRFVKKVDLKSADYTVGRNSVQ